MSQPPILVWIRRDFRLSDHGPLDWAVQTGRPVIPVFVLDDVFEGLGAAPKWRLGKAIEAFDQRLRTLGSRLILRKGPALDALNRLIADTGATTVCWMRAYDPATVARDTKVKAALKAKNIAAKSFAGHVLFEPWTVETGTGGFYKVYTPFWKAVRERDPGSSAVAPKHVPAPDFWPDSDILADWGLHASLRRGASVLDRHTKAGEGAAIERLNHFVSDVMEHYKDRRDLPALDATSRMSDYLSYGEISPRACWNAAMTARDEGNPGAEKFLQEVVWRDFAYHLMWHTPQLLDSNWKPGWDTFPWSETPDNPKLLAWKQGRTGVPFVDAAMREMYVTGRMHNRARMIAASFLTKHLMVHWQVGLRWFEDCLTDWDPASNAMGWQWVAGCGPDAAPFFRIFNPETQREKFDRDSAYVRRWIAEGQGTPGRDALSYFDAVPESWGLKPDQLYPQPVVDLKAGREHALDAYRARAA